MTAALAGVTQHASAQPRYRFTPLAALGNNFTADPDTRGTMGINNKGQVVYGYVLPNTTTYHAWLWLPASDYGLAAGFHDLATESSSTDDATSIARDINESGYIVGQAGATLHLTGSGTGAVWTLASGVVTFRPLPLFSGGAWSSASAVNDQTPPVIVGVANLPEGVCDCDGHYSAPPPTPFKVDFSTGTMTLVALDVGADADGLAIDVNTPQGSDPLRIAGFTDCTGTQDQKEEQGLCFRAPPCRPPMDAVYWSSTTRNVLTDLGTNGSHNQGINDAAKMCGWGFDPSECLLTSLFWNGTSGSPISLPPLVTGGGARADALNDLSPPQVVGSDNGTGHAALWEFVTSTPVATDLDSSSSIGGCTSRWLVRSAHDINDSDWIVVMALDTNNNNALYAALLTPFPACAVDIVQTGCVDTDDIIAVIGGWGACPIGAFCVADVNGDCVVNTDDLIAVNVSWGCSPCGDGFAGPEPRTLEELIAIILESGAPSETVAEIIEQLIANWP